MIKNIPFRALTRYQGGDSKKPIHENAYEIANAYAKKNKASVISVQYQGGHQQLWTMTLDFPDKEQHEV